MDSITSIDFSDNKTLEKYSSAFTFSDMEIFIFPDLFYPLLLANIMSEELWEWRDDPWFKDIEKKEFTYKANRVKQFIIQNYIFNLDLSTWGLTTKSKEINRFMIFLILDCLVSPMLFLAMRVINITLILISGNILVLTNLTLISFLTGKRRPLKLWVLSGTKKILLQEQANVSRYPLFMQLLCLLLAESHSKKYFLLPPLFIPRILLWRKRD